MCAGSIQGGFHFLRTRHSDEFGLIFGPHIWHSCVFLCACSRGKDHSHEFGFNSFECMSTSEVSPDVIEHHHNFHQVWAEFAFDVHTEVPSRTCTDSRVASNQEWCRNWRGCWKKNKKNQAKTDSMLKLIFPTYLVKLSRLPFALLVEELEQLGGAETTATFGFDHGRQQCASYRDGAGNQSWVSSSFTAFMTSFADAKKKNQKTKKTNKQNNQDMIVEEHGQSSWSRIFVTTLRNHITWLVSEFKWDSLKT